MRRTLMLAPLAVLVLAALPPCIAAQAARDNSIDPGMTKAQVIEHLGPPQSAKASDTLTYLYYKNGCEKTCGMNDVVILSHDKVVDAIFRDPTRRYSGQSSSPTALTPAEARKKAATIKAAKPDSTPASPPIMIAAPKPAPAPPAAPSATPPGGADSTKPAPPKADSAAPKPPEA